MLEVPVLSTVKGVGDKSRTRTALRTIRRTASPARRGLRPDADDGEGSMRWLWGGTWLCGGGGLDERFGLGFFNVDDLAGRIQHVGFELAVAHDLFIHHFGSRRFQGDGIDAGKLLSENGREFAAKWGRGDGKWQMANGRRQMANGRFQMPDGKWQMADGG
ncbi:MAG: hypothetical protein ACP5XB_06550 [Isosphaeraceae bacterium]